MANPRQRRKSRSSSYKPVSHSRHAKRNLKKTPPIRGPKVLQDAWDNTKTVRQNYLALGLIHTLNPLASGGVEPPQGQLPRDTGNCHEQSTSAEDPSASSIPKGFGKIIRDEAGNILRVEICEEAEDGLPENREQDMDAMSATVVEKWVTDLGGSMIDSSGTSVVKALERISTVPSDGSTTLSIPISRAGPRHSSRGEVGYLERLVGKYGNDVEGMSRDRKLNPDQRTAGSLRRALKRAGLNGERS